MPRKTNIDLHKAYIDTFSTNFKISKNNFGFWSAPTQSRKNLTRAGNSSKNRGFFSALNSRYPSFNGCSSLTSITIPSSVTNIGERAFENCSNLKEIHSNNTTPPTCEYEPFKFIKTANCKLYVPIGTKEKYAFADGWGDFVNIIEENIISTSTDISSPTIKYENGQLMFDCPTPDATFLYTITSADITSSLLDSNNDIIDLSKTYNIKL